MSLDLWDKCDFVYFGKSAVEASPLLWPTVIFIVIRNELQYARKEDEYLDGQDFLCIEYCLGRAMISKHSKQRLYASLLILGACILLFRTILMTAQGQLSILVAWVSALLFMEMVVDAACLSSAIRWWVKNDQNYDRLPLRLGAAAALLHAFRVLVFVLGRTGPWVDFDVRPAERALHSARWSWAGVYFAAIMSGLGVLGVLIIWMLRRRAKRRKETAENPGG